MARILDVTAIVLLTVAAAVMVAGVYVMTRRDDVTALLVDQSRERLLPLARNRELVT